VLDYAIHNTIVEGAAKQSPGRFGEIASDAQSDAYYRAWPMGVLRALAMTADGAPELDDQDN
jgi:hypothetical protein